MPGVTCVLNLCGCMDRQTRSHIRVRVTMISQQNGYDKKRNSECETPPNKRICSTNDTNTAVILTELQAYCHLSNVVPVVSTVLTTGAVNGKLPSSEVNSCVEDKSIDELPVAEAVVEDTNAVCCLGNDNKVSSDGQDGSVCNEASAYTVKWVSKNKTFGPKFPVGVRETQSKTYEAYIDITQPGKCQSKQINLGTYKTLDEACQARKVGELNRRLLSDVMQQIIATHATESSNGDTVSSNYCTNVASAVKEYFKAKFPQIPLQSLACLPANCKAQLNVAKSCSPPTTNSAPAPVKPKRISQVESCLLQTRPCSPYNHILRLRSTFFYSRYKKIEAGAPINATVLCSRVIEGTEVVTFFFHDIKQCVMFNEHEYCGPLPHNTNTS